MRSLPVTFLLLMFVGTMHTWADTGRKRQKRAWIIDSFSIEEENPGPFPYKLGKIVLDRKYLVRFELYGQGVDKEPKNILSIDKNTGDICVHGKVDYEAADSFKSLKLKFEAKNTSNNEVDTRLGVEIKILDINDNPPIFQHSNYEVTVEESHAQDKNVATVFATDKDDSQTANGTFSFTIKSVTPKTDNVEFYINQQPKQQSGTIFLKGCLDYEKAQKYTILVEAKDHGEKKQLSSTSTLIVKISDKNNHLPEFSGQTGSGKVKERDTGVEVLRLQVTDKDSRGSQAWKAKYTIHGDKKEIFKIETDPDTNEGILTVVKPMDFEEQTYQNLSISVQNEAPYFSCKIKKRTPDAMWELDKFFETPGTTDPNLYKSVPVTIHVEDVNDPPVFIPSVKEVVIMENVDVGTHLTTVTAKDLDGSHGNTFKYVKGEDPAGWITVDAKTGKISTAKILDRESPYVINSTYKAIVYAVDDGEPPLTGTGTVLIHLKDENDNVPLLTENHVNMCLGLDKEPTMANITAVDLDLPPYSSPFYYELLGDVKGKWRIDPAHGTTVRLVKENSVYSGHHLLQIRISDQQGHYNSQNLSVTVCDCSSHSNCHAKRVSGARVGSGAAWVVVLAILALAAILLMAFLMSCKSEKRMIPLHEGLGRLIATNTENPGTDCMLPSNVGFHKTDSSHEIKVSTNGKHQSTLSAVKGQQVVAQVPTLVSTDQMFHRSIHRNSRRSFREIRNIQRSSFRSGCRSSFRSSTSYNGSISYMSENIIAIINQRLLQLEPCSEELGVYQPHCYADEGEFVANDKLDAISIPETDFDPEMLKTLDNRFNELATICRPDLMKT